MRHLTSLSIIGFLLLTSTVAIAQRKEYFTEAEIDSLRDAQGLKPRIPAYLKLADKRLIALGLKPKPEKELEEERKAREQHDKQVREAAKAGRKPPQTFEPVDAYLLDFTRSELLRGYVEALDEAMSSIDDAYSRKLDVRESLEELEHYCDEQQSLLRKFEPKTAVEKLAIEEAMETTEKALADARGALEYVPKTEKSNTP